MAIGAPPQAPRMEAKRRVSIHPLSADAPVPWSLGLRWLFRFGFTYLVLASLYFLSELAMMMRYMALHQLADGFMDPLWHHVVPWIGSHVLHLSKPITIFSNGSGDTTYDWVLLGFELVLAAAVSIVWSLLDSKRPNYRRLHVWLRMLIRFVLAAQMISYGMDKAFPLQFGTLSLPRLTETVGNLTPEGMLWLFMAASVSYTVFGGVIEVVGGLLLLFPKLVSLGALVCLAAMTNVFMLNMGYNVPVKLGSFQYMVMAGFLLVPEIPRLSNVFLFNRMAQPVVYPRLFRREWLNRSAYVLPTVLGLLVFVLFFWTASTAYKTRLKMMAATPPLYGIWTVESFMSAGNQQPPLFPGDARWHRLIFQNPKQLIIQPMNGNFEGTALSMDAKDKTFTLKARGHAAWKADFKFETAQPNLLDLNGTIDGKPVEVKLHRIDETKYPLTSMGFHWINEHSR